MTEIAHEPTTGTQLASLPRIVFVLGKGGVGRSTVAAALALARAARGERVLVVEWAVADPIGPWFGQPAAGARPCAIAPGVAATNFSLDEALRAYFVDHLHLPRVYRHVIAARPIARLLAIAPGLAEMFFLGQLWWLVTLAEREAGLAFDRIVVDAPATGHATSLLDVPATIGAMDAAGLLAVETTRVIELLADPARTCVLVVALGEPLVVAETRELVPRVTARLGRAPLALIVNRSVAAIAGEPPPVAPPQIYATLAALARELDERAAIERELHAQIDLPSLALPELLGLPPREVVRACAEAL